VKSVLHDECCVMLVVIHPENLDKLSSFIVMSVVSANVDCQSECVLACDMLVCVCDGQENKREL